MLRLMAVCRRLICLLIRCDVTAFTARHTPDDDFAPCCHDAPSTTICYDGDDDTPRCRADTLIPRCRAGFIDILPSLSTLTLERMPVPPVNEPERYGDDTI